MCIRDRKVAKLRKRYTSKINTLDERLRKAVQTLEREQQQASKKKFDVAVSFGTAILGAMVGNRRRSTWGTAMRRAGGIGKESGDVERAEQTILAIQQKLQELQQEFQDEVDKIEEFDAQFEELKEVSIKPKSTDINIHVVGLLWRPYIKDTGGPLEPNWE